MVAGSRPQSILMVVVLPARSRQQAVDLAVFHLYRYVLTAVNEPNCLGEIRRADGNLAAQGNVIVPAWKGLVVNPFARGCARWRRRCSRAWGFVDA